ncbi:MAG: DUF2092 domain-containing protein [Candidatus Riflebacteria bacterium]|nr:DUF2092 domain-containing protein [Candidatus Riflebacteria bacterium]
MRRMSSILLTGALLTLAVCPAHHAAIAADARPVDPFAAIVLRGMSSKLASAGCYDLVAQTTLDEYNRLGQRIQYENQVEVAYSRPDRMFVKARGDLHNLYLWYDGRTVTKVETNDNTFATLSIKGSVERMMDTLAERFDATFPLADFVVNDIYANFVGQVTKGRYEGIRVVDGQRCHHLVFSQEMIDWQIWIVAGQELTPAKFVITYKTLPGHPQFTARFRSWRFDPPRPPGLFVPSIPDRCSRTDFAIQSVTGSHDQRSSLSR